MIWSFMFRRFTGMFLAVAVALLAGCHHNKVANPIANVDSKQPDKVLFDRAMDAMQHGKYDVARMTLQTLINTYPDSEFIARAKLAVGDSWYAEGTSAAYAQAEEEYSQFQVFFPNMAEAAEAQKKIGDIHFRQMEKADRDPTQALKAEDAYRQLVLQYPDSKLVPEAKEKLREVQEVLADREYGIGHFYYLRGSYPAAIARLKSLTDTYPLFSQADDALFMLGTAYEKEADYARTAKPAPQVEKLPDGPLKKQALAMFNTSKEATARHFEDLAAETYSKIVTQYPVMDRAKEARERLEAMHRPVPSATQEAIARNKAEQESRGSETLFGHFLENFHHGPSIASAARTGEPTLDEPPQTSATDVVAAATEAVTRSLPGLNGGPTEAAGAGSATPEGSTSAGSSAGGNGAGGASSGGATGAVGVERVPAGDSGTGSAPPAAAQPGEAQPAGVQPTLPGSAPATQPATQPAAADQPKTQQPDNGIEELKPIAPQDTTPAPGTGGNAQPPAQIKTGITSQDSQPAAQQQDQSQPTQNTADQAS
ncbi:MAG TPA: outer membrane protein assembly factor BamD, partial [Terriglobales bacterium]|nr:outer membrane protein assembly factor BamD [Terriglobales bacterium]